DLGHAATDGVAVGRHAGLEHVDDVLLRPIGEPLLSDVGDPAFAVRIRTAGKALRRNDAAGGVARAMALRAMPGTVDEIGAAIPGRRLRWVGCKDLAIEEQELPEAKTTTHIERKCHVVVADPPRYWRQGLDESKEVTHVLEFHSLIGCIGQRRV